MKIAFICVNYNNSTITTAYVQNILSLKQSHELNIVVVDNASKEEELILLKQLADPKLTIIYSDTNVGYFKGLNKGVDSLDTKAYDYVLVGNNDLTFAEDFLDQLQAVETASDVLVLAPNIIRVDGIHQNPHIVANFSKIQRIYRRLYYRHYVFAVVLQRVYDLFKKNIAPEDRIGHEREQEIFTGYGACYILTRHFFNHFERLDAPTFLMGEELVLANQLAGVKGKTLYKPNLIVHHHDHASIGKVPIRRLYEFSRQSYQHYFRHLKNIQ